MWGSHCADNLYLWLSDLTPWKVLFLSDVSMQDEENRKKEYQSWPCLVESSNVIGNTQTLIMFYLLKKLFVLKIFYSISPRSVTFFKLQWKHPQARTSEGIYWSIVGSTHINKQLILEIKEPLYWAFTAVQGLHSLSEYRLVVFSETLALLSTSRDCMWSITLLQVIGPFLTTTPGLLDSYHDRI